MTARSFATRAAPWTGLITALPGWALHQQLLADMLHYDCHLGRTSTALIVTAVVGSVIVVAGAVSWRARAGSTLRRFVALLGVSAAAIALFAIALQMLAAVILPGCGS